MTLKALANFLRITPEKKLSVNFVNFGRRFQRHSDHRTGGSAQTVVHHRTGNIDRPNGQPAVTARRHGRCAHQRALSELLPGD